MMLAGLGVRSYEEQRRWERLELMLANVRLVRGSKTTWRGRKRKVRK